MVYEIRDISDEEFDEFVEEHYCGNILQTTSWADVKRDNFQSKRFAVCSRDGSIEGTCQMLIRKVMGKYTICYVPRGFVCDYNNAELLSFMIDKTLELAKGHCAIDLIIEPYIERGRFQSGVEVLLSKGFIHGGYGKGFTQYQPRIDMKVDINMTIDQYLSSLKGNIRNRIKNSEQKGLVLVEGSFDQIAVYEKINEITEGRNGVKLRNKEYFERIYKAFKDKDKMEFVLVKLDRDVFFEDLMTKIETNSKKISEVFKKISNLKKENKNVEKLQKTLMGLNREKESLDKRKLDFYKSDEEYLSGAIVLYCGDEADYVYAASSNYMRNLSPNIYMNYKLIERAIKRGCKTYNMGGVNMVSDINDGLFMFKSEMNGTPFEYEGYFRYPLKPFFSFFMKRFMKFIGRIRGI